MLKTVFQHAESWRYQLDDIDPTDFAKIQTDVLVIDYSRDGSDDRALTIDEVTKLQCNPDGTRRVVLCYLSIGEAEDYRFYWRRSWKRRKPDFLLPENKDWEGNYSVKFWKDTWQKVILNEYIPKIVAAGFDGVYLDKVDVYEDIMEKRLDKTHSSVKLQELMVDFISKIVTSLPEKQNLCVMQNAEHIKGVTPYIDGVAKEELLFGMDAPQKLNNEEDIHDSTRALKNFKKIGKKVLVVEYLDNKDKIALAEKTCMTNGFVYLTANPDRNLNQP